MPEISPETFPDQAREFPVNFAGTVYCLQRPTFGHRMSMRLVGNLLATRRPDYWLASAGERWLRAFHGEHRAGADAPRRCALRVSVICGGARQGVSQPDGCRYVIVRG